MRATLILRAGGGFWKRTLDEFKTQSARAINLEGVSGKFSDLEICKFREPADITSCKVFCDGDHGGYSTCSLTLDPSGQFARFSGNISIDIPPNREDIQRSGYAAWRTKERGGTLFSFGARNWDIDPYTWLALRVKSDGASYYVNLQTDGIVPTDIHQHRLFAKRPGEWENIYIPFNDFVRTNFGQVIEPQDLLRHKLKTVGLGLIDRVPGPFEVLIDRIWATDRIKAEAESTPFSSSNIQGGKNTPEDPSLLG